MTTNTTLVFVYGTLLSGFSNNRLLARGGAQCLGPASTRDAYTMLDLGAFPAVLATGRARYMAPVVGEVYECTPDVLADLDALEGYHGDASGLYDRKPVQVQLDDGIITTALIYVMHDSPRWRPNAPIVPESDWCEWSNTCSEDEDPQPAGYVAEVA